MGELIFLGLLVLGAVIGIQYYIAQMIAKTVELKGYTLEETHALAKCFWLGVAGWVYVLALPNKTAQTNIAQIHKKLYDIGSKLDEMKNQ